MNRKTPKLEPGQCTFATFAKSRDVSKAKVSSLFHRSSNDDDRPEPINPGGHTLIFDEESFAEWFDEAKDRPPNYRSGSGPKSQSDADQRAQFELKTVEFLTLLRAECARDGRAEAF